MSNSKMFDLLAGSAGNDFEGRDCGGGIEIEKGGDHGRPGTLEYSFSLVGDISDSSPYMHHNNAPNPTISTPYVLAKYSGKRRREPAE